MLQPDRMGGETTEEEFVAIPFGDISRRYSAERWRETLIDVIDSALALTEDSSILLGQVHQQRRPPRTRDSHNCPNQHHSAPKEDSQGNQASQ